MPSLQATINPESHQALAQLFHTKPPLLVEVRFLGMGTSSDWHLVEEEEDLGPIWEPLAPGVELILQSVWDLRQDNTAIHVIKNK